MPADLGPVKDRSSGNVGGWIFHDIEDATNRDAASGARTNPKLGDTHELAHDDDRTCRHISLRHEVDGRTVSNVDCSNVYDLCVVAHGVSSLAQANADKGISGGCVADDFAEILGANIVSDHSPVFIDVDLGSSFELDC